MQESRKAAALSRSMISTRQPEQLQGLTSALVCGVTPLAHGRISTPEEFAARDR
jgi:hypothetical protein